MQSSSKLRGGWRRTVRAAAAALATAGPALAVTGAALQPGCFFFGSGPSKVGQGKQYQSGDPTFDEFFAQLYELQVELGKAPDQEKQIRTQLAQAVALEGEDASATMLGKKVRKQAEQIAAAGTGLQVQLNMEATDDDDEAAVKIDTIGQPLTETDQKFVKNVERATADALLLKVRMAKRERLLDKLRAHSAVLTNQVEATFRKSVQKKGEVKKNLEDANTLIPLMTSRAREVGDAAKKLAVKLKESAHTDDGSFAPPPPPPEPEFEEEAPEPPPPPEKKGGSKGGGSAGAAPKKPAGGPASDFEP